MTDNSEDLKIFLRRVTRFCIVNIRWLTRGMLLAIALLILLHVVYPPSLEWMGELFGMAKPSLATVLALMVLVSILERVIVLEEVVRQPPLSVDERRTKAYKRLSGLVDQYGARRVALLQLSGQTVKGFLRDLAERYPKAEVRLLLMRIDAAAAFDHDDKPGHRHRILTTVQEMELIAEDYPDFRVTTKYYDTPPGISAIVVDDDIVSISWYFCYRDAGTPGIVRVRGHLSPTMTAVGDAARPLLTFARTSFDAIWQTAADSSS